MTDIQLTDEELILLNDALNSKIREAINYPDVCKARDLKAKLITAQNQQKVVEPINVDKSYLTLLNGNHPSGENHLEEFDDMDSGDYPDSIGFIKEEVYDLDDNVRTIHPTTEEFDEYMDRYNNRSNP